MTAITIINENMGLISIRNEDGTQWLIDSQGVECWTQDKTEAGSFPFSKFVELSDKVATSMQNDCPDNGFFGYWNLTFHEGMQIPVKTSEQIEKEIAEGAAYENYMRAQYGADYDAIVEDVEDVDDIMSDADYEALSRMVDHMPTINRQGERDIFEKMQRDFKRLI